MGKVVTHPAPVPTGPPAPLSTILARAVDVACNGMDGAGELPSAHAPTSWQKAALVARAGELSRYLTPGAPWPIASAVAALLQTFTLRRIDDDAAKVIVAGYVTALDGMPLWAVELACKRALKGEAGARTPSFAPTPPELRRAALALVEPLQEERARIQRAVTARLIERAPDPVMGEKLRALAASLAAAMDDPEAAPSPVKAALEKGDVEGAKQAGRQLVEGVTFSPEMLAKLAKHAA